MRKTIIAAIVATMVSGVAMSQTASVTGTGMGLLQNDWVKAGVNTNTGTLGSGGNTSPGLLFDPSGTGTFNPSYDYLTPGSPFDGFSLKVDSTNRTNNNVGTVQIAKTGGLTLSNSNTTLTWSGAATYGSGSWTVNNAYTLGVGRPYIDITTTIVAGGSASNVYFAKFIDPDSQGMPGDSSATDNVLGYGAIPSTNVAFSEATVSRYALGLYSAASNVRAGINGWNTDAASYINADASCGTGVLFCRNDHTIGLTFQWTGVSSGATLTASYAYIFGPSAFGAASSAVTGGAGGGTPGTAPGGGTLTDVGSATSAASSGGSTPPAPTVTGTATVNGSSSYIDTNGDTVVLSSSMIAGDYLTRQFNTLTTTEIGRVTTTPRSIITSYSDGSTTSASTSALTNAENYYRAVDVTHNDVSTSAVADTANRTFVDSGSVAITTPSVTPNADYSIRTGTVSNTGIIARTTTTPTLFTYDRTTTTVTSNDFAPTSAYSDSSSTVVTNSTVSDTYNVITAENFNRTVTRSVADSMIGSEVIATPIWVSNGIDSTSLVNTRQAPITRQLDKSLSISTSGVITANELYTVTTPTRFTYNRIVNTVTVDDYATNSVYSDTTSTVTDTSTVTGDYDVVSSASQGRTANYAVNVGLRNDQVATVNQLQAMINRNAEFGKSINYRYYDHNRDGYRGHSTVFGVGHTKDIEGDMDLGLGINKIDTRLTGNASSVQAETVQLGATLSKKDVQGFDLSGTVQHSMSNYNVSATPSVNIVTSGDTRLLATQGFNNSLPAVTGKTTGRDTSLSVKAVGPSLDSEGILRPVIGATYGQRSTPGYVANMEVLPGVSVANRVNNINQDYGYATLGAVAKYGIANATVLRHTDGVTQYGVGLAKTDGDLTFNIRADRLETTQGGSNVYTAGLVYKF